MSDQKDESEFDVEGHRIAAADGPEDDTEGHKFKDVFVTGDDEDVEGHKFKDVMITGDDEDVEGHRFDKGGVQPPRDSDLGGTDR